MTRLRMGVLSLSLVVSLFLGACASETEHALSPSDTAPPTLSATSTVPPTATNTPQPTHTPTATSTPTPTATNTPTLTPTTTSTATPTATKTPMPTYTPTATPIPTPTLDLFRLGYPEAAITYDWGEPPAGFLAYDEDNYYVYERVMHNRPVRVVIHKQAGIDKASRDEIAEWLFYAWASAWNVFDGFPYASYTFKIPIDQSSFWGAQGIGHEVAVTEYVENFRGGWDAYLRVQWRLDFAHEIFHAWNFSAMPAEDLCRNWFGEGCTEYYSARIVGDHDPYFGYKYGVQRMWSDYQRVMGSSRDMPLADAHIYEIDPELRTPIIYAKGGLVCYMIDQRLMTEGHSLDDLMRTLYHAYVADGTRHTPQSLQATLEGLTNDDWSEFFSKYIYGTAVLPLDGRFDFLQH